MPLSTLIKTSNSRLYALFWLRCCAIVGQAIAVLVTHYVLAMPLPLTPLLSVTGGLVLINAHAWQQYRRGMLVSDEVLAVQLAVDIIALALLLYFTGGVSNPFASLFLLPLAIAAATLPVGYSVLLVVLSLFLYASLMSEYIELPPVSANRALSINLHTLGLGFVISSCLLVGFIAYLANRIRELEQQISSQHDIQLRQEQVLALGTLAAGMAHELGTPLSTIAVLAHELESQVDEALRDDVMLLGQQVGHCKQILGTMLQKVELAKTQELTLVQADELVTGVLEKFQILRPLIQVDLAIKKIDEDVRVAADATLEQALLNVLNNAADASAEDVSLLLHHNPHQVMIDISDRGLGFPEDVLPKAGRHMVSTKGEHGMGVGLFLANATLTRLGGEIAFLARDGGGTTVKISLPIQRRT